MGGRRFDLTSFPRDGVWFVRWIDGCSENWPTPNNPVFMVVLSRLLNDVWEGVTLEDALEQRFRVSNDPKINVRQPMQFVRCPVHAGALTGLFLGAVFDARRFVGRLGNKTKEETREYSFDLPTALSGDDIGLWPANATIGAVLGNHDHTPIIPYEKYQHHVNANTLVTVLNSLGGVLVLPSSEIIRTFLSPVSAVIRDLVRGPPLKTPPSWSEPSLGRMLGPGTGFADDGRGWRVALAAGIAERHAPLIANLYEPFSPAGWNAAVRVHQGVREKPARLAGAIPFASGTLSLTVRVFPLSETRNLGLEITHATWPAPNDRPIEILRWIPADDPEDAPKVVPINRMTTAAGVGIDILSDADPDFSSHLTQIAVEGVAWTALPKQIVKLQTFDRDPNRTIGIGSVLPTRDASLGHPGIGTGVAAAMLDQVASDELPDARISRFDEMAAIFDQLLASGAIICGRVIPPSPPDHAAIRGALSVWRFRPIPSRKGPGKTGWAWIDKSAGRVRTVFASVIALPNGQSVTWMEIEPRDANDLDCALIVAGMIDSAEMPAFLDRVRDNKRFVGLPPTDPMLDGRTSRTWKHVKVTPASVLKAITEIASGP